MNLLSLEYGRPTREQANRRLRDLSRPLGWPTHAATILMFVAVLGGSCNYFYSFWVAFIGVPCLAVWWIARALCFAASVLSSPQCLHRREKLGWLVLPVAAAIATGLLKFDLPERALFSVHRAALEQIVASAAVTPGNIVWRRRVGFYGTLTITKPAPGVIGVSIPAWASAATTGSSTLPATSSRPTSLGGDSSTARFRRIGIGGFALRTERHPSRCVCS